MPALLTALRRRLAALRDRAAAIGGLQSGGSDGGVGRTVRADGGPGRVHAERDGDVVVFVLGMRINSFWKVHRWLPVALVAPRMVRELRRDDESGLLGSWTFVSPPRTLGFVQYWESFEALESYAHDGDALHRPAWTDYYREHDDGSVGIWHETYRSEEYESVYNHTPPRGLGAAAGSEIVPATGERETAAGRIAVGRAGDD